MLTTQTQRIVSTAMVAALGLCPAVAASAAAAVKPPFPLAVYVGDPNGSDSNAEAQLVADYGNFTSSMHAHATELLTYIDYTQSVDMWPSMSSWSAWSTRKSTVGSKLVPLLGLPLLSTAAGSPTPDAQFQAFANGSYDAQITQVIAAWGQQGFRHLIVRIGWEMNLTGPTYAGGDAQTQADWVAAFQHVSTLVRSIAAAQTPRTRVEIVWNPAAVNWSYAPATTALYPGDDYVDIIGVDIYGDMYPYADAQPATYWDWDTGQQDATVPQFMADPVNRAHYWTYPAAVYPGVLDGSGGHAQSFVSILNFALQHHKTFAVPECGAGNSNAGTDVTDDATFPQWLGAQLAAGLQAGLSVGFVGIWDSNAGGNYAFSYAADGKPTEAAAWRQSFGRPAQ